MSKDSKKNRNPKRIQNPGEKAPRTKNSPSSTDHETPAWQFHRRDKAHELWGWDKLTHDDYLNILNQLCSLEGMTWNGIKQASGGKAEGRGTNHHSADVDGFSAVAKKRLQDLKLDDVDELFSLRLNNTLRLYAIKEGRVLKFIWYDPYHGSKNGAYPTKK